MGSWTTLAEAECDHYAQHSGLFRRFRDARPTSAYSRMAIGKLTFEIDRRGPKHTSGLPQRSKRQGYSITPSARSGSPGGMLNPSAFAVFMLMTNSYLVGA